MPELPELDVICEVLARRVVGQPIVSAQVLPPGGPIVVRDLTGAGFAETLSGAVIAAVGRRGKFVVFTMGGKLPLYLALNPKLSGRLQLVGPSDKRLAKTHVILALSGGGELRYVDQKQMGQLYLAHDLAQVPDFAGMGPEALEISRDDFRARLRAYRGEIKGILIRSDFVAGIGNAYADEILWAARLHPYRKRTQLTAEEINRLYDALRAVLLDAVEQVRAEMGEAIHREPRGFMTVHLKTGQPCPRCGAPISLVGANQRITNFCRTCQPGGLIKGM